MCEVPDEGARSVGGAASILPRRAADRGSICAWVVTGVTPRLSSRFAERLRQSAVCLEHIGVEQPDVPLSSVLEGGRGLSVYKRAFGTPRVLDVCACVLSICRVAASLLRSPKAVQPLEAMQINEECASIVHSDMAYLILWSAQGVD